MAFAALCFLGEAGAQEKLTFPSLDADLTKSAPTEIFGLLFRPEGSGPFPAVVALHGCAGLYGRNGALTGRHREWAERLQGEGYAVLLVDSFSPRGVDEVCTKKPVPVAVRQRTRDAYAGLVFLQQQDFVLADRIGALGWSMGGSTVLSLADHRSRARPAKLPKGDFRAAVAFYPGCYSTAEDARWRTVLPLLILAGAADDWTPSQPCVELVERERQFASPMHIVVYPDAHHGFDAPNSKLRTRDNLANIRTGNTTATVGTNPAARADSLRRVSEYFARHLKS